MMKSGKIDRQITEGKMTNRERVIAAIRNETPDYTPHNVMFTRMMLEKMIGYSGDPDYINTLNNHIIKAAVRKPQEALPGRPEHFIDEFGVVWNKSGVDKDIGVVSEYRITNADELAAYQPPPVDEDYIRSQFKHLMDIKEDNFAIASVGFTIFERAWSLCGMEDLLCYMLTDPEAVESLFLRLTERCIWQTKIALEYDIDGVWFGDDWGQQRGLIMGRPLWVKLLKPCFKALYSETKAKGKYVLQHCCGDISGIFDDLIEIGLDVHQTFQPEIYDIREYKKKLGGRLAIWGAISTQADLPFKTPSEIYQLTKNTIEILGKNGGYIAAPTHEVPPDVPPENIEAMVKAFRDQAQ